MDRNNDDSYSVASTNVTGARRAHIADQSAVEEGIRAGNINISSDANTNTVSVGFSSENMERIQRSQDLQRRYDLERQARSITIPTTDDEIKSWLRQIKEPITLFGEGVIERGERLKTAIAKYIDQNNRMPQFSQANKVVSNVPEDEEFYTVGSSELKKARLEIAKYSIPLASYRLELTRRQRLVTDRLDEELKYEEYISKFGDYEMMASQYADERCVSRGDLSYDNQLFATSGWTGECKVWGIPDTEYTFQQCTELKGHRDRVNHIRFHPQSTNGLDPNGPNIATASADTKVRLWTLNQDLEHQNSVILKGHEDRANYAEFHPMGTYVASSSHDQTWRFWDIETQKELLCQEGHVAAVYPLSFQNDGALIGTGDLNGIASAWDLRSGKSIYSTVAHRRKCIALKFLPNCYQFATGGDDNQIKIWDLRKKACVQIIPAHFKLVSGIYFEPDNGNFMISTSYDGKCKIWNTHDWTCASVLSGYEAKVSSASFSKDTKFIITTSFDRTFKLWERKKQSEDQEMGEPGKDPVLTPQNQSEDVQMQSGQ